MVYNLALNYVQNREDAEEITQDVFVSVYKSLDQFAGQSAVSTWIYRIAINRSLDHIKSRKRKKRYAYLLSLVGAGGETLDMPHFDHPGVQMEYKQATAHIFSCIDELPDKQRTALLLSKTERLSQVEVAEVMGISPKAAESLVQRAKANLATKLGKTKEKRK